MRKKFSFWLHKLANHVYPTSVMYNLHVKSDSNEYAPVKPKTAMAFYGNVFEGRD